MKPLPYKGRKIIVTNTGGGMNVDYCAQFADHDEGDKWAHGATPIDALNNLLEFLEEVPK